MHLDVCCFYYHVSWQKMIIIRPNFDCSRLFKLFFLFQLFIVLYFCCMYDFLLPLCGEIKITTDNISKTVVTTR